VETEVAERVNAETEARMTEAMQRMNLSEADINRALHPPNQIGNTEMENEESKEAPAGKKFPKRNGRYQGE
jgi:wyosine [tRNA(Phe)-imidazoG37] synthetase (radical SAM superfamily)